MLSPTFKYETYPDVRANLFAYSLFIFNVTGLLAFFFLLTLQQRQALDQFLLKMVNHPLGEKGILYGTLLAVSSFLAYVLVEVLKIYDRWYDKYVVRWRERYSTDFMLPRLCAALLHRVSVDRFFEEAERNLGVFMERLFYPFVRDHAPVIPKNLVVRFYERVTTYWITQLNEVAMVLLLLVVTVQAVLLGSSYFATAFVPLLFLNALFVLNRRWVLLAREDVRRTTAAEISAIANEQGEELEKQLRALCGEYNIPFQVGP